MSTKSRMIGTGAGVLVALGGVAGVAAAASSAIGADDDDQQLTGDTLTSAVDAATAAVEGRVVDTETGDDGAAYGVEIQRPDGSVVEVELDASYNVIGTEADEDESDGQDDAD
jgi:uncharacterized membrane protein YkoI